MIVLIGIAVVLLLLLVLGAVEQRPGFTSRPSVRSTDRDDVRAASDLQLLR
jgi:ABC-type transporter Mla subunit MlaD